MYCLQGIAEDPQPGTADLLKEAHGLVLGCAGVLVLIQNDDRVASMREQKHLARPKILCGLLAYLAAFVILPQPAAASIATTGAQEWSLSSTRPVMLPWPLRSPAETARS